MHIIANIFYFVCVLFAILAGVHIRHKVKTEQATEKFEEVFGLLMVVSLILIRVLSLSPFHLLWMFPVSFLFGPLSVVFPFRLLWPLASFYGSLWCIGVRPRATNQEQSEFSLLKDSQWSLIDGELCRVTDFCPLGSIKDGKVLPISKSMPYASVTVECKKLPKKIEGFICHKIDFMHLWMAFIERGIKQDEEVLIIWTKKHYKNKLYNILSASMPKIWVMICPKGAFELEVDKNYKPDLIGQARWNATKPIIDWKPEVIK